MSKLISNYEISIWEDVWDNETSKFKEEFVILIGSDKMESQSKALEPVLTKSSKGSKKLTFKLVKHYYDNNTGKKIVNPFVDYLKNETKVKLKYKNKWYDFIVKNIQQESAKHTYSYTLEDALTNELSKNGFGVVLDTELQNNSGTIVTLAERALADTDWTVEAETPVQTTEEALVYLTFTPKDKNKLIVYLVQDPRDGNGTNIIPYKYNPNSQEQLAGYGDLKTLFGDGPITALAFYSSCRNKPYCFQFIYLKNGYDKNNIRIDNNRIIQNADCQYYIQYNEDAYTEITDKGLILPKDWAANEVDDDSLISSKYRGARFVQSQQTKYLPKLQKYVNLYKKGDDDYYGYQDYEIVSPEFINNIITNPTFKSDAGWVGANTSITEDGTNATVTNTYGKFDEGSFVDATKLKDIEDCQAWLKIEYSNNGIVFNNGPMDDVSAYKYMNVGDQWILKIECCDSTGADAINKLQPSLQSWNYNPVGNYYTSNNKITTTYENGIFTINTNAFKSLNELKINSQLRLGIAFTTSGTYYISKIYLYRAVKDKEGKWMQPIDKIDLTGGGSENEITSKLLPQTVINWNYYYFTPVELDNWTGTPENFIPSEKYSTLQPEFIPQFNNNSEKIATVSVKESNYFNILQSIAEAFEMWLQLDVERDARGAITKKKVKFTKTLGTENYACFRYGVNLKDIKRTYESSKIVTKLIVKNNNNEFAPNGMCTIARASANPLGENYIYDFSYYFNQGLMNEQDYYGILYAPDDGKEDSLLGYYSKLRKYNDNLEELNTQLSGVLQAQIVLKAQLELATQTKSAAEKQMQQHRKSFQQLSTYTIEDALAKGVELSKESKKYLVEYRLSENTYNQSDAEITNLTSALTDREVSLTELQNKIDNITDSKIKLNKLFYTKYARFIQEGTWIDEKYTDNDAYYVDALNVLYNSAYPQVSYNINVYALSALPGYELFTFDLGDTTFVEDPEFFGENYQEQIVITETVEHLEQPDKNTIKVQNFRNQFQDLFQKITATVQSVQFKEGSYQKAVSLVEDEGTKQSTFVQKALANTGAMLEMAGQQSVTWGADGITITDLDTPTNMLRMIGGAILLSSRSPEGYQEWTTGLTSQGLSANLITAGIINAQEIAIMNGEIPAFRWDANGISAFNTWWDGADHQNFQSDKFVRFDKYGLYGIDGEVDGLSWVAENIGEINDKATFALTWDGLRVNHSDISAHIGRTDTTIINITKNNTPLFVVGTEGNVEVNGVVHAKGGSIIGELPKLNQDNKFSWLFDPNEGMYMWAGYVGEDSFTNRKDKGAKFAIYNKNQGITDAKAFYTLSMRGEINADSGKIANYIIEKNSLVGSNIQTEQRIDTENPDISSTVQTIITSGMSAKSEDGYAFWAGEISTEIIDGIQLLDNEAKVLGASAPFRVDHTGKMYCQNIEAVYGKIGDWQLSGGLSSRNITISPYGEDAIIVGTEGNRALEISYPFNKYERYNETRYERAYTYQGNARKISSISLLYSINNTESEDKTNLISSFSSEVQIANNEDEIKNYINQFNQSAYFITSDYMEFQNVENGKTTDSFSGNILEVYIVDNAAIKPSVIDYDTYDNGRRQTSLTNIYNTLTNEEPFKTHLVAIYQYDHTESESFNNEFDMDTYEYGGTDTAVYTLLTQFNTNIDLKSTIRIEYFWKEYVDLDHFESFESVTTYYPNFGSNYIYVRSLSEQKEDLIKTSLSNNKFSITINKKYWDTSLDNNKLEIWDFTKEFSGKEGTPTSLAKELTFESPLQFRYFDTIAIDKAYKLYIPGVELSPPTRITADGDIYLRGQSLIEILSEKLQIEFS